MTNDFIEDLIAALNKEGKIYVLAVFEKESFDVNVWNNLDDHDPGFFILADGSVDTVIDTALRGIKFSLTGEN
jgi:hypothetical protein